MATYKKEKGRKEQVHQDNQKDGHDHGAGCGSADLFGASRCSKSLEAPNGRDSDSKHHTFDQPSSDVRQ